ncbi:MAG: S1/P1 nuclease [Paramuribaculum sp.]|nr:S1/P1 nuclease [Paramuribaculum sp.]
MLRRLFITAIVLPSALLAMAWGQKGHDVTAAIAERHLTPAAKAAVDSIFDGYSLVYWANWLDNASHNQPYAYTKTWHYKNVDEGVRYEEAPANPAGDAVTALKGQMEVLLLPQSTPDERAFALKILTHVTGDIHQPMHMGHATDLGGNRIKIKYFNRDNNLHSIWDNALVESAHKWSYTEWVNQIDRVSPEEADAIVSSNFDDWAKESVGIAADVYRRMPSGANISYNEVAEWTPVIENRLLYGGLRLAHLLNFIFDKEYAASHAAPYTPAL